jgi:transcriptional regulator with XRE-family HTH domain
MVNVRLQTATALKRLIQEEARCTQRELAAAIYKSQSLISGMMSGDRPGKDQDRRKIAEFFEMSYEEFLEYGKEEATEKKEPENIFSKAENDKHHQLIDKFKDTEKATLFNEMLLFIEDLDPDGYELLFGDTKKVFDTIKRLTDKKTGTEGE